MDLRKDIVGRQIEVRDAIRAHDGDRVERLWLSYLTLAEDTLIRAVTNWLPQPDFGRVAVSKTKVVT